MNSKEERVGKAHELYEQGLSIVEIAAQIGVTIQTVGKWKLKYQWVRPGNQSIASLRALENEVQLRVLAFTMYCNGLPASTIAKQIGVTMQRAARWQAEDDWEKRRDVRLQSEVMPIWAQQLQTLLLKISERQSHSEQTQSELVAAVSALAEQVRTGATS